MPIKEIYTKFGIPPNLQEHMFRVCSVVDAIREHWTGKEVINWNKLKAIALLHDLGNVVKFDFDKHPEFLGREQANIEYWRQVQAQVIQKYGTDDHVATKAILKELGIAQDMQEVILHKSFGNSLETRDSNNWPLKILYYADLRTLPFGIGTLEERLKDIRDRMPKYTSRPDFEDLIAACLEIEKQIQSNLDIPVAQINNSTAKVNGASLQEFNIPSSKIAHLKVSNQAMTSGTKK